MESRKKSVHCDFVCICGLTVVLAVAATLWLDTDQVYTHLFYLPIAWVATRKPRHTLLTGALFALLHMLLVWMHHESLSVFVWLRALMIVLVAGLLQRIWHKEKLVQSALLQLDFERFHDTLTGTCNRQFFEAFIRTPLQYPVSIFYCDINGLKAVNDTHGHETGDRLIRATAALLHRCIRLEDKLIRMGGDEFIILAQRCGQQEADGLIHRIRDLLQAEQQRPAEQRKTNGPELPVMVDFALGHALALSEEQLHHALSLADKAMYADKNRRRDS